LLCLALLWVSSHLTFRLDISDFLPEEPAREGRLPTHLLRELSGSGRLAVLLEADEEITTSDVELVFGYLVPKLAALNGVGGVNARLTTGQTQFIEQHLPQRIVLYMEPGALAAVGPRLSHEGIEAAIASIDEPAEIPLPGDSTRRARDPLGLMRLAARAVRDWIGVSRVRLIDGFYALPGARAFFLTIETENTLDDYEPTRAFVESVEGILSEARADPEVSPLLRNRRLYAVGRPVSYASAVEILSADGTRVALAATVTAILLMALLFRRPTAPLVIVLTVACGLLITAAMAVVIYGSLSLVAWVFIGLLVGLGVDFGIHIAVHFWVYGSTRSEPAQALASALARPGLSIATGALTSAAAFLTLLTIPYPWIRQLATLTALGLLAILVCSFTVLPLLLSLSRPATRDEVIWSRWGRLFERASRAQPALAVTPWIVLVGASLAVAGGLRFEPHPWKLAVRGNPESARLDRLSREAGSAFTPVLLVSRGSTAEQALDRDREAVRRLRPVALRAGVATIQSLARWLPAPEDQRANIRFVQERPELFSPQRFRQDFEDVVARMDRPDPYLTEEYLPQITRSLNPDIDELALSDLRDLGLGSEVDRHLTQHAGEHLAVSYVFLRRFPWAEGVVSRFLSVVRDAGIEDLPGVTLAGDPLRSANHAQVIRRTVALATVLAVLLVSSVLWLRFRHVSLVVLCLMPLACGLSAAVLVMRLAGIELNLLSIAIAPIVVGIGVDDGIHVVGRLREGHELGAVLREAGSSITMTTLTTVGAFACLGLATFTGVREVGLVGAVALLVCLLASLHIIPVGWRLIETRRARPDGP
jgi:predicted exporter